MSLKTVSMVAALLLRFAFCFSPPSASSSAPVPTLTTMPVSPTCRVPPTILMWSPILNHLTSSSAWKESGSLSFSCLGKMVTMLPSTETECTLPIRFFRSPSITLTRSPTASIWRALLATVAAARSSSSAALPMPTLKRSSSGSEGVTSSPQRRPLIETTLTRQPSSKVMPSYANCCRPPATRMGPSTSPPSLPISSGLKRRAGGRILRSCASSSPLAV
mmetsp:Transcript_30140/g.76784  ORF Transcript_30140/g.76784 Transcript_30140/m.76784 type:complete len:219 (-) Transcript_30140:1066-1722(-)